MTVHSDKPPRIPSLDGMRFIMCLGIALYHFIPYIFLPGEGFYDHTRKFAYFTDIFFIVSGFFLARSNRNCNLKKCDVKLFYSLRIARIYPLHLTCLAFYAAVAIVVHFGFLHPTNDQRYDFLQFLPNMLLVHSWGLGHNFSFNFVSWSLSALWLMYLLYPAIALLARTSLIILVGLIVATLFAGSWLTADLCGAPVTLAQSCDIGVLRAIPSFLFGVLLAHLGSNWIGRRASLIGLLVVTTMIVATPLLEGIARLILVYLLFLLFVSADASGLRTPLGWSPLTKNARYSFGIFLIHPIIGEIFFFVFSLGLKQFPMQAEWHTIVGTACLVGAVVATMIAAAASYVYFEKPAERLLKQRLAGAAYSGSPSR